MISLKTYINFKLKKKTYMSIKYLRHAMEKAYKVKINIITNLM